MSKFSDYKEFTEPIINRPVDDSLVLWMNGRGSRRSGSVLADLSKKGNTGTIVGATWANTPLGHSVMSFDGENDYIDCGNGESLSLNSGTQDFTIETWFYPKVIGGSTIGVIIDKREQNGDGWAIRLGDGGFGDENKLICFVNAISVLSADITETDRWYHAIVVIDRDGNGQWYIDGQASGSAVAINSEVMNTTGNLIIGRNAYGGIRFFNGSIDDVRIYNRALSAGEISKLYEQTKHYYGL